MMWRWLLLAEIIAALVFSSIGAVNAVIAGDLGRMGWADVATVVMFIAIVVTAVWAAAWGK